MAVLSVSCQEDKWLGEGVEVPDGYVALSFSARIPAMEEVMTRSVDPDGGGVQDMSLFCFDSYGLFITTVRNVEVTVTGEVSDLTGTCTAVVPENTRTIHFLANQNLTDFQEDHFRNKSEAEVVALLEGSSGRMIYWARFACQADDDRSIKEQMADENINLAGANQIRMIRNHAQVSVTNPEENGYLVVTGLAAYNTNAFGTVAPYHPEKGFNFTLEEWKNGNFVTLPANDAKLSDVTDVTTNTEQYIFESENGIDDPVSIIIRGHAPGETENDDLYYRVMLVDEQGDQLPIRRNHRYLLNITGALSYGQATFEEALTAAATNNVWISISDEVTSVEDQKYILTVGQTDYVFDARENAWQEILTYTVTGKGNQTVNATTDKPTVTWIDNDVAAQSLTNTFTVGTDGVGQGSITVTLRPAGSSEKLEGTLLVKKGRLQRKIKVITVKEQSFTPSWVGTALYGGLSTTNATRPHVTVMFTVPETCPAELFPMKVYISVNELDIRAAAGMALSVVRESDKEWYSSGDIAAGGGEEPDYKYVWTVEEPGVQRVYFESILSQADGYTGTLHIEAKHFGTMTRTFAFTDATRSITVEGLKAYNANMSENPDGFSKDEYVLYRLVPQKRGARVTFDLQLREKPTNNPDADQQGDPIDAGENAEFLLYSQNLNYLNEENQGEVEDYDCEFERYAAASDAWWRANNPEGGRMMMFRPKDEFLSNGEFANPDGTGKYSVYLYTNKAKSDEVIRIASNLRSYPAVMDANGDGTTENLYIGNEYRSVTFELANYNPFRFGARVKYGSEEWQGQAEEPERSGIDDIPETVTPLTWTYQPDQPVDIAFDLTSFKGSDGNSVHPFKDEDFEIYGSTFDIYIDAPMLEIDENRLSDKLKNGDKLKAHPTIPGRFIYTASRDRDTERTFGTDDVVNEDETGVNQSGERKTLPFKVKTPVSAGDIIISSDQEQVVFYSKTFRVTNSSITGTLKYVDDSGTEHNVPAGAFVAFERVSNNSRIGSVTVTTDGRYELRLRKEYAFNWYTDQVRFHYELNGTIYHGTAEGGTLATLFDKKDIILQPEN